MDGDSKAVEILRHYEELATARTPFIAIWDEIKTFVTPHRAMHLHGNTSDPSTYDCEAVYDTTATHAADTLAQGMLSQITPMESPWFALKPPEELADNDEAIAYYGEATELVRQHLTSSNFYPAVQEFYIDRSAYGTAALRFTEGDDSPFQFKCEPLGTYVLSHKENGDLDQFFREFELTGRQAQEFFGDELPSYVAEKAKAKPQEKHKYLHLVEPRKERDKGKPLDPEHYAYRSVYICKDTKEVIGKEGGLHEHPYIVSRYRTWGSGKSYGWSPSVKAMPDIVQVNFLEKMQDFKAEQEVMPPLMAPDNMEGQIDLTGGSINYVPSGTTRNEIGRIFDQGRYDIGQHRSEERRNMIRKAFHVDMLEAISNLDDGIQRTAAEIQARLNEKIIPFSPTFSLLISEFCNPLLKRCFSILYKRGIIPPPPESILQQDGDGVYLNEPEVQYTGRIALAIEQAQNAAFMQTMGAAMEMAQAAPEVLDVFDFQKAMQGIARNYGTPESWIRSEEEQAQIAQAKAQAAEEQAQMMQAQQMADVANTAAPAVETMQQLTQ